MKKVLPLLLASLLLAAVTTGVAVASEPSTQDRMIDAATALAALDGNDDADKKLEKAVEKLAKGLDASHFDADGEPVDKKAMEALEKAAKELAKAGEKDPSLDVSLIDDMVSIARDAAEAGIAAAEARGADAEDIEKATEELAKGDSEEKPDKAIDKYKKAWEKAQKADPAETPSGTGGVIQIPGGIELPAGAGKYSAYTFHFVDLDTGEEFTISGHNAEGSDGYTGQSNEGFLYVNEKFGTIQLHVSCSDAFTGGSGDKSDPSEDSSLRVQWAEIVKVDGGEVDKACQVSGLGEPPVGTPGIDVEKFVSPNGIVFFDADTATDALSVFQNDPITFRIVVTNSGNVPLTGVTVTDPLFDLGDCGFPTEMAPGETASCDINVLAAFGARSNTATASGQGLGMTVTDSDSTHYYGADLG